MSTSKKRIGVIGVGFGAQVYVPGLQSEGWEVAALCSRHETPLRTGAAVTVRRGLARIRLLPLRRSE